ncbi:MAG: ribosomal RNA small subunit methyltransferase A [Candidatus Nealsonbacteria bacterium RIFCSPLOWO2_01_FULL_43_36]|nr:MAG: ribosomal RNA small subunit methyltransferase A [Candidatus Nealsonbacteria bacterium RIFCSPLOWO2_01_FULL_43_36]
MDLTSKQNVELLLKKHGLRPQKRLGQNFLIDRDLPQKLVAAAQIDAQDTVLEIGPGIGAITQALAQKAKSVIAIEKDRNMVEILKETLKEFSNVEIVQADVLRFDLPQNKEGGRTSFKIVGNLPFYLTAPVIRKFLELSEAGPQSMTLVVQKEVAQRICAKPPKMSILANAVQFYAEAEIVSYLSKKSFYPEPKVDAALIKIIPRPAPMGDSKMFFEVVKAGFSHPRKQLLNNLSQGLKKSREEVTAWLQKNNISPQQRAETLSIEDWIKLMKSYRIQ